MPPDGDLSTNGDFEPSEADPDEPSSEAEAGADGDPLDEADDEVSQPSAAGEPVSAEDVDAAAAAQDAADAADDSSDDDPDGVASDIVVPDPPLVADEADEPEGASPVDAEGRDDAYEDPNLNPTAE